MAGEEPVPGSKEFAILALWAMDTNDGEMEALVSRHAEYFLAEAIRQYPDLTEVEIAEFVQSYFDPMESEEDAVYTDEELKALLELRDQIVREAR